ncbi:uncharacterized protein LOC108459017 [Gossypium arboreum]|uniref:uncharacterized protein LOC108459017 n=1 Tax=Gossypium arboreum TaxID=29729 RepID=UPI0008192C1F|nr:uncharacterized protein LOC108459017 [Gossypium arboreum]
MALDALMREQAIVQGNSSSIRAFEPIIDSTVASPDIGDIIPDRKVDSKELVDVPDKEVQSILAHMPYIRPLKLWTQPKVSLQSVVIPPVPFPQRFKKNENDKQYQQFLNTIKQLQINITLVDVLVQISSYEKFIKDLSPKKKKITHVETIALTEGYSVVLTNKLPPKLKDPDSFTSPCSIGNQYLGQALCDLGASINLMPLSTFRKLGIGHMKPTAVTLQLADRSLAQPEGKIKDVLVRVDNFFLTDFIILDCKVDNEIPIILVRPFLATGRNLVDVHKGELTVD